MFIRLHKRGIVNGILGSAILALLVHVGSRRLLYFDAALIPYLFATLFAVMGIIYRYTVWLDRPPTRMLWKRSVEFVFSRAFFRHLWLLGKTFFGQIILQRFVGQRSIYRWLTHFQIAWGTLLAFAITFPLVFGWLHFETAPSSNYLYQLYVFGFPAVVFHPDGILGFFFFNALNLAALLVVVGTVMAFTHRILHPSRVAAQTFANDMLPLLILFSVAISGLFLTYSTRLLGGEHYRVLSTLHCFTVVVFLVYLPFGKFFHIFQRGAQLGAAVYIHEKKSGALAECQSCHNPFISQLQKEDVKKILEDLGFHYEKEGEPSTIQDLCPLCRRRMLMWAQHRRLEGKFDINQKEENV